MEILTETRRVRRLFFRNLTHPQKLGVAIGVYLVWTLATYLLEGRLLTLLRPEATGDRLVYTLVANVLIGTVLAVWMLRPFIASGFISREQAGFQRFGRTVGTILVGGILGFAVFILQNPASTNPIVVANAYAQVLLVSIAEVLVCWAVIGTSVEALTKRWGKYIGIGSAVIASSVLFGIYHFAHSPPFNTFSMVALLTVVGIGTSLVYFVGRDLYATIVFHNFLGVFGVIGALAEAGQLASLSQLAVPSLVTAFVAVAVLVAVDWLFIRRQSPQQLM